LKTDLNMGTIVPDMSTAMPSLSPNHPLFSKTRQAVLSLLYGHPHEQFYLRQIVELSGVGTGGIQRELQRLTEAGILRRSKQGMHVYYQADANSPIYEELRSLVVKTMGVVSVLREALKPLEKRIAFAFVFGSIAHGEETNASDVDVMVVGNVSIAEVVKATSNVEPGLRREINPTVYSEEEFWKKIEERNHFLTEVLKRKKLFIIGDEDDIRELA